MRKRLRKKLIIPSLINLNDGPPSLFFCRRDWDNLFRVRLMSKRQWDLGNKSYNDDRRRTC